MNINNELFKSEIKDILFKTIQDLKIHQIDKDNTILEIDYDNCVNKIIIIIDKYFN